MALADRILYQGSRDRKKQLQLGVPGGMASGQPGVVVLDTGETTPTAYKLFVTTAGVLNITSGTTFADGDGSAVGSSGGANTALSNLAAVAINASLAPGSANAIDAGTDAKPLRSVYAATSIIFDQTTRNLTLTASEPGTSARTVNFGDPGANDSVAYLAASQALTTKTYNGLTIACASANQFILTSGTSTITMTEGNTDILLAAGAQLDIAGSKTVDIDQNLTVNTEAVTLNQSLSTTDDVTFDALTVTSVTDGTATLTAGALSGVTTIGTTGAITCRGITNTIAAINSTLAINIGADNVNLTLGAAGAAASRIYYDGDDLILWDSKVGAYTLQQLATGTTMNPYVVGDLTVGEGKFNWIDAADEVAGTWAFAGTTNDSIAITAASNTTGNVLSITSNSTTTNGALFYLASSLTAGYFAEFYNGSANVFTVGRYGATVITGNAAGTSALTLAAGDFKVTSGFLDIDSGIANGGHNIASADTGSSAVPLVTITNSSTAFDQPLLLLNGDATGAYDVLQITHDSTGYGLSVIGTAVTGKQALFRGPASQTTSSVLVDGETGSWIGAANVGMLHLISDGALADVDASLLYSTYTGTIAAAATMKGTCGYFKDGGAASGSTNAVYITSTANNCLNLTSVAVGKTGLTVVGPDAQTASMVVLNGTGAAAGWGGAATTGMLHLTLDGTTLSTSASALKILIGTGTPTDASLGYALSIADTTGVTANPNTTFAAYISTLTNSGMKIVTAGTTANTLVLAGPAAQATALLTVDASTGTGWVGAANIGAITISGDGTAADVASSFLYIARSGTGLASNLGSSLRISDSTTAAAGAYVSYMTSTNNSVLNLVTAAVAKSALVITGPASQTAAAVTIGGAAVAWIGGAAVGMLQLDSNGALVADASLLKVTNATQPAVANDGICGEFIDTGTAQATSYAVRIASTNNEALHVDTGLAVFDEGPKVQYAASACTDNAPTQAQMNTAFGITAAAGYNGFIGALNDSDHVEDNYICFVSAAAWYWLKGTAGG